MRDRPFERLRLFHAQASYHTPYLQGIQDQGIAVIPYEHFGLHDDARKARQFQTLLVVQPMRSINHAIDDGGEGEGGPFLGTIVAGRLELGT